MAGRIGLVGRRTVVAIEVASLGADIGAHIVAVELGELDAAAVDVLLVDAGSVDLAEVADGCWKGDAVGGDPDRGSPRCTVVAVCLRGEADHAGLIAAALGASHVVELPEGGRWLAERLAGTGAARVLAVVAARGGVGGTTVAIAAAAAAALPQVDEAHRRRPVAAADPPGGVVAAGYRRDARHPCLLVDADPSSAGLDLPLGIPEDAGVRWTGIPATHGSLDAGSLCAALPVVHGFSVLSGALPPGAHAERLPAVLSAAREEFLSVVVDLGRGALVPLVRPDAVVLVVPATLAGVVSARRLLDEELGRWRVHVVVRPSKWLPTDELADRLGCPVVADIPRWPRAGELGEQGDIVSGRTGRSMRRFGRALWEPLR